MRESYDGDSARIFPIDERIGESIVGAFECPHSQLDLIEEIG
jgi:hypothetical protein